MNLFCVYVQWYSRNNVINVIIIRRIERYNENIKTESRVRDFYVGSLFLILIFVFTCELVVDAVTPNWTAAGLEVLKERLALPGPPRILSLSPGGVRSFPPQNAVSLYYDIGLPT